MGCAPSQRKRSETEDCDEEVNNWAAIYNTALKSKLETLKMELNDISFSYFDVYQVMSNFIHSPSSYGKTPFLYFYRTFYCNNSNNIYIYVYHTHFLIFSLHAYKILGKLLNQKYTFCIKCFYVNYVIVIMIRIHRDKKCMLWAWEIECRCSLFTNSKILLK